MSYRFCIYSIVTYAFNCGLNWSLKLSRYQVFHLVYLNIIFTLFLWLPKKSKFVALRDRECRRCKTREIILQKLIKLRNNKNEFTKEWSYELMKLTLRKTLNKCFTLFKDNVFHRFFPYHLRTALELNQ